jgi:hypothetical protein
MIGAKEIDEKICFMENAGNLFSINASEEALLCQYKCEQYCRNNRINYTMKF